MLKIHKYSNATAFTNVVYPVGPTTMHLTLEQFRQVHGGDFLDELPAGHRDPMPGYSPYRTAAGQVLGVSE